MRVLLAPTAAALALAPAGAFAVEYMSAEQAAKLMFPEAERFEPRALTLDAAQMQQLAARGVAARSAQWSVQAALRGTQVLGYVVADAVIGKFELIGYAVGLTAEGAVKQVEVLSYRESHGHEVRLPAWRKQFVGKTAAAPLRVGEDIANISGATLSCTHVTDGVRRIVAVVEMGKKGGVL
ncbi:FMN-binding protein [Azohydromonas lata]|uniref:FMN-binding protein n=1 Tax=Azohydromonas lata TaxID=45677 RepID=UPI000830CC7D|nr:FMN-binding protein [Azohydromonas lata]